MDELLKAFAELPALQELLVFSGAAEDTLKRILNAVCIARSRIDRCNVGMLADARSFFIFSEIENNRKAKRERTT